MTVNYGQFSQFNNKKNPKTNKTYRATHMANEGGERKANLGKYLCQSKGCVNGLREEKGKRKTS